MEIFVGLSEDPDPYDITSSNPNPIIVIRGSLNGLG